MFNFSPDYKARQEKSNYKLPSCFVLQPANYYFSFYYMSSKHELSSSESAKNEEEKKNKGGRPKKAPEERQENIVVVRFSEARFAQLMTHVRAGGQTMAGVVKQWMEKGMPLGLTAEQHACVRYLPRISNDLGAVARLLNQQPDRQDQAAELLALQARIGQLLTSFQQ